MALQKNLYQRIYDTLAPFAGYYQEGSTRSIAINRKQRDTADVLGLEIIIPRAQSKQTNIGECCSVQMRIVMVTLIQHMSNHRTIDDALDALSGVGDETESREDTVGRFEDKEVWVVMVKEIG